MHIAVVLDQKVPCVGYGGTERQVDWLITELVRRRHRVTLIARPGSAHACCDVRHATSLTDVARALPADADVVHSHGWHDADPSRPSVKTFHGNLKEGEVITGNCSFVSARHAEIHGRRTFVYNGFPVDSYRLAARKTPSLLFLAGIARPGKGLHDAVRLARKFDFRLDIAGGSRWKLLGRSRARRELLFLRTLSSRFTFHGIVDGEEKLSLLGQARAFLNPVRWEEPFGMAPVEAMLCGTPVLATPRGAMPEVVQGDGGRLFESDAEFAAALGAVGEIPPARCRDYAADRFPIARTAERYLELYRRVLDGETLP
ncbi:MAG TPA: glycosyltransferase family 4 protein [Rhizobiales bacterium]|nr:glycosyltransferase family 4 protein [Hyphomicrobiales bacterium]